jgi:hypothetical protein
MMQFQLQKNAERKLIYKMDYKEIHTTYDPMESSLIKAKLTDENIPFNVTGDFNITMSMETFNSPIGRMALKRPIKFYVPEEFCEAAISAINTDNSSMLEDDLEY